MGLTEGSAWWSGSAVTAAGSPPAQPQALCGLQQLEGKFDLACHPLQNQPPRRLEGLWCLDLLTCSLVAIIRPNPGACEIPREEETGLRPLG